MATFDDIKVMRPALAKAYLGLIAAQPERPLALFAPRRVGKTYFLDQDLTPAAKAAGMLPIYVDVWLNKDAPLEAINHALEEALDALMVPASAIRKNAQTTVKKITILGSGVDLGDPPQARPLPIEPAFRFDSLLARVAAKNGGKLLLMLDEVQTFGSHPQGNVLLGSLRAGLTKHKALVSAVFTGSSQVELAQMFSTAGAPMYQYAQNTEFPMLGEDYLLALSRHFARVHPGKVLSIEALGMLFKQLGHKPALLRDIVKAMSAEGLVDCDKGLEIFRSSPAQRNVWNALIAPLSPLERVVLIAVAKQLPITGKATITQIATALKGSDKTTVSKIRTAVEKLTKFRLLAKNTSSAQVDDPLFLSYLKDLPLDALLLGAPALSSEGSASL